MDPINLVIRGRWEIRGREGEVRAGGGRRGGREEGEGIKRGGMEKSKILRAREGRRETRGGREREGGGRGRSLPPVHPSQMGGFGNCNRPILVRYLGCYGGIDPLISGYRGLFH